MKPLKLSLADPAAPFIADIISRPDDDSPRLQYADWLDENGEPKRAEFIRVQWQLARLGPPHVVVTEPCHPTRRHGPDYYSLSGGEETANSRLIMEVQVGGRVDILKPLGIKTNKPRSPMYGLRVQRITDNEIIVVRDGMSVPWAGEAPRARERELWDESVGLPIQAELRPLGIGVWLADDKPQSDCILVRRGFVDELRCPLATLTGGPCPQCVTPYADPSEADRRDCPDCRGTGRTPGLAHLGAVHPIRRVVLTDREPTPGTNGGAAWYDQRLLDGAFPGEGPHSYGLPPALYTRLGEAAVRLLDGRDRGWAPYPSALAARDALSAACLAWLRTEAVSGRPVPA